MAWFGQVGTGWDRFGQSTNIHQMSTAVPRPKLSTAVIDYVLGHLYALKASSTLRIYVEDVNNNLISRKLEIILGSLIAKIRPAQAKSMKDAAVTDFLVRPSV